MRFIRLLRDFLLVHRRAVAGMCILIVAAALIVSFFGELQDSYRNLFHRQERNTVVVYLTFSALLVVAFLTSIFPASLFGVVGGMLFGVVTGFGLCAAALMAAALIAFRAASRRISAEVVDLHRLEGRLARHGPRYALMIRASPIAPFGITSYALA